MNSEHSNELYSTPLEKMPRKNIAARKAIIFNTGAKCFTREGKKAVGRNWYQAYFINFCY